MRRLIPVILLPVFLLVSTHAGAQQTNPNNRRELERLGLILSAVGSVMIAAAAVRGDWETRLCPQDGESWREVSYDEELCFAQLDGEKLTHLKPKPDWTLTAMGGGAVALGLFTYFLSRRYPRAPDLSITIGPNGATISHRFSF